MSQTQEPIFTNVRLADGVLARVYFNDLPLFQGVEGPGGFSQNGGITHLCVPGENEVAVEILRAPPLIGGRVEYTPDPRPDMAGKDLNQSIEVFVFKRRAVGSPEPDMILHFQFPDVWKNVPVEQRQVPYYYRARFDPDTIVPPLAFLAASPQEVPCEGTRELHDAVRELHAAFEQKSVAAMIDVMDLQMREYTASDPGYPGASRAEQISAFEELFENEIVVAPLVPELLHFTPRAGGRVVHVVRTDFRAVIDVKSVGVAQGSRFDPVFTFHDGRWRLM